MARDKPGSKGEAMKNAQTRRLKLVTEPRTGSATRARSHGRPAEPRDPVVERTRELAQRRSGTLEILLLWHPQLNRVEVAVRDLVTDASLHLEVAPGDAVDAFYHPYAYAARPRKNRRRDGGRHQIQE
jgi:hypothetical protein